jgi:hypothetical protein
MKRLFCVLALLILLAAASSAPAAVPQLINFQGLLTTPGGTPVANGPYMAHFSLYSTPTGGTPLWSEVQVINTSGGVFSVILGSVSPIPDSAFNDSSRYLGVQVGGDPEMTPRQKLTSVAFANRVGSLEGASGGLSVEPGDPGDTVFVMIDDGTPAVEMACPTPAPPPGPCAGWSTTTIGNAFAAPGFRGGVLRVLDCNGLVNFRVNGWNGDVSARGKATFGVGHVNAGLYGFVAGAYNTVSAGTNEATIPGGYCNIASNNYATVGGGTGNTSAGLGATVAGGSGNIINSAGAYDVIGGGQNNVTSFSGAGHQTIGGGELNGISSGLHNTIGGGLQNSVVNNINATVIGGGHQNTVFNHWSTIGGGELNTINGRYATIAGGQYDTANGWWSAIGGGLHNVTGGGLAITIAGGEAGVATADYTTVSGGQLNSSTGPWATVGGGNNNAASAIQATIGGGHGNVASNSDATIGGGNSNGAIGSFSTIGGGFQNKASGLAATVGGGELNNASADYTTVAGGQRNTAAFPWAAIGGGQDNLGLNNWGTVAGGQRNTAAGLYSAIGGGLGNVAAGQASTIGGGDNNQAPGDNSTVPGGIQNIASGTNSFAAGTQARAADTCSFVWADCCVIPGTILTAPFYSNGDHTFNVRATGGVYFVTSCDSTVNAAGTTTGVVLPAGGSAWSNLSDSTMKRNIRPVDGAEILAKIAELSVNRWSYKAQGAEIEHIGPMAQDFYRIFGVGDDERHISTLDPDGIALAAAKELYLRSQAQAAEIASLKAQLERQTSDMQTLNSRLADLQATMETILAAQAGAGNVTLGAVTPDVVGKAR